MGGYKRVIVVYISKATFVEDLYCFTLPLVAGYGTIIYVDESVPKEGISKGSR